MMENQEQVDLGALYGVSKLPGVVYIGLTLRILAGRTSRTSRTHSVTHLLS